MKATGIVRRIDDLNRIIIPKEIMEKLFGTRHKEGQPMEIFLDSDNSIILKPYKSMTEWDPVVNANGELTEFVCGCGYSSLSATNYCANCGTKKDNTDIEERIKQAKMNAEY